MSSVIEIDLCDLCVEGNLEHLQKYLECEEFDPRSLFDRNDEGLMPFHLAILNGHCACVEVMLKTNVDLESPFQGLFPIHLALAQANCRERHQVVVEMAEMLIRYKQDVTVKDRLGRTALHQVCATGPADLVPVLIAAGLRLENKDFSGKMPIHVAIEYNQPDCLRQIIQEGGSDMFFCTDARGDKPIHVAVRFASWECFEVLLSFAYDEMLTENNEFEQTPAEVAKNCGVYEDFLIAKLSGKVKPGLQTFVFTDDLCTNHANFPDEIRKRFDWFKFLSMQPENQVRLEKLLAGPAGSLLIDEFKDLVWFRKVRPAQISDLIRVHEYSYLKKLKDFISTLSSNSIPVRFDIDTRVTSESFKSAQAAAGAVLEAVDSVMSGQCKNAFCCIRPPGHHVGPFGAVASEEDPNLTSTGFCLFNNVAVGAAYAKYFYSKDLSKIAIIDFDVHHGNGTEAIIKNLNPSKLKMHLNLPMFQGALEYDSYKPWFDDNDGKNVLFVSSHAYGRDGHGFFYPASGTWSSGEELFPGGVLNVPLAKATDSLAFRKCKKYLDYRKTVFPRLLAFAPDIIFISAGFDAHGLDDINHGFVDLDEDDFRWVSEEIVKIANTCCKGRIVSVLEGGYGIKGGIVSALGLSVAAHVRVLMKANQEQFVERSDVEDVEKMAMKSEYAEKSRELKRSRSKYLRRLEADFLKKLEELQEADMQELPGGSQDPNSSQIEVEVQSNTLNSSNVSDKSEDEDSNSEDQGDYTSEDSKLEDEDKDLGNSPID